MRCDASAILRRVTGRVKCSNASCLIRYDLTGVPLVVVLFNGVVVVGATFFDSFFKTPPSIFNRFCSTMSQNVRMTKTHIPVDGDF